MPKAFAPVRRTHREAPIEIVQLLGRTLIAERRHTLKRHFLEATGFRDGAYRRHGFAEIQINPDTLEPCPVNRQYHSKTWPGPRREKGKHR